MAVTCPKCHHENTDSARFCADCGTLLGLPETPQNSVTITLETSIERLTRGTLFAGRYEIIEALGIGGMGEVYRVEDMKVGQEIALKLIKPEIASNRKMIERFRHELKTARMISHRNICRMFDLGEEKGAYFITMEFVAGEDLRSFLRRSKQLALGTSITIAKQICEGLAEAHRMGVVHRDLKPGNIMIDEDGNVRIMDFGIASFLEAKSVTGDGSLVGTPAYMSPEQVAGKEVDQRSDIYSLGIILYEMSTGRVPFEGDTPISIAMKHKGELPRNPKQFNPAIPDDLSGVILKCLEKDKAKRYQTAGEVRLEFNKIEKSIPTKGRVVPERKPLTSRDIADKFNLKKLLIPGLMIIGLIVAAMIIIWRIIPPKEAAPAKSVKHSVAILPFMDLSPKKDYEYLCEGIPETLINALTKIKNLRVPARASAFSFKGKEQEIKDIGQKLNVDTVLKGSVQVIGDRLRITSQLISIADGNYVWSDSYDRKLEDVFAIQDEIAREIVKSLKIELFGEKEAPLVKTYTENLQAYDLYLQGLYFWNKRTADDLKRAIAFFNQSIEMDANNALAYVGLADCYLILPQYVRSLTKDVFPKAKAGVSKALDIDDKLAEAHTSLAMIMTFEWNWEGAEKEFRWAIALNPNYATGHHWYRSLLESKGRLDEALEENKRALELDPVSVSINTALGRTFYYQREYDQAIQQCRKTLDLDQNFAVGRQILGECYRQKGMLKEAIAEFQKARIPFGNNPYGLGVLGNAYGLSGEKAKAIEILTNLKDLSKQGYSLNYDIAFVYYGLGDREKALEWLEQSYKEKEFPMRYLKVEPAWESLRSDPRFKSLLKRMNLE